MVETILLIAGAFLLGSIPSGYLAARFAGGIDIREYGSGNVGASNVMVHVNPWVAGLTGAFDCVIKGALPVLVGRWLGLDLWVQGAAGFASIAGHNWSPFLRFTGGRGVGTAIGVALGLMMWREVLILGVAVFVLGRLVNRDTGFWTFVAVVALPIAGFVLRQPVEIVWTAVSIGLILLAKRLTANWESPQSEYGIHRVFLYRLIWDRDVPKRIEWTDRRPG